MRIDYAVPEVGGVWPGAVEDPGYHQPRLRKAVDGFVGMKVGMGEIERHRDTALVRLGIRRGLSTLPPDSYSSRLTEMPVMKKRAGQCVRSCGLDKSAHPCYIVAEKGDWL